MRQGAKIGTDEWDVTAARGEPPAQHWGPRHLGDSRFAFRLWAPDCKAVMLEVADGAVHEMDGSPDGWFSSVVEARWGDRYRFRVTDDLAVPDPAGRAVAGGVHGWSVLVDPEAYTWRTGAWEGRPWSEAVIMEVHAGALGGYTTMIDTLDQYAELGVTAIELMPLSETPGRWNWGYDGVLPYAPHSAYGTPDELKALIDAAHARGLMVYLDVVYNHFGPDGNYLGAYASPFFDHHAPTPWGAAVAVSKVPVRRFFIDNALMWLNEYRFDGLRFDAVHAIADETFLEDMAEEIRRSVAPGRHVHLMLENERNDARPLENGYDAQWNDDFHNAIHVLLTGEPDGYYGAFADKPAAHLARALGEGFAYQGELMPTSGHARGTRSGHLPVTRFVNFLQNHDQIGNRAFGERLTVLTAPERLKAATVLLLCGPFVPLLFMGDETGSEAPFLFFTDFDEALGEIVREGRRKEFAAFPALRDPAQRAKIPDPNAPTTFERSRPVPGPHAEEWRALYRQLLDFRHAELVHVLDEARTISSRAIGDAAVAARWRLGDGRTLSIFANLGTGGTTWPEAPQGEPVIATGDPTHGAGASVWLEAE